MGAWLGFVTMKIRFSDWNDDSRSVAARKSLNQVTIGSALIGATLANLAFRSRRCVPSRLTAPAVVREANGPITATEIQQSHVQGTVYDLVVALRRGWLDHRGTTRAKEAVSTPDDPEFVVYLNEIRLGTLSELRTLPLAGVIGVQYYDGAEATFNWGLGHARGAIQVRTLSR